MDKTPDPFPGHDHWPFRADPRLREPCHSQIQHGEHYLKLLLIQAIGFKHVNGRFSLWKGRLSAATISKPACWQYQRQQY
jgi:hypothetical protein